MSIKETFLYRKLATLAHSRDKLNENSEECARSAPARVASMSSAWEMITETDLPQRRPKDRTSASSDISWQEYSYEDDSDPDLAQQVQVMREVLRESQGFGSMSKHLLLNYLDGLEHLAGILKRAESCSRGSLSEEHRDRLDEYRECLCNNMTLNDDMYSRLIQKKVIGVDLAEELKSVGTRRRQCATLLDVLKILGEKAFSGFCAVLRESGQGFLVDTLGSDIAYDEDPCLDTTTMDCPSFERHVSERAERVVLPVSCYPKSSPAIMMDISVNEGGHPLLDAHGRPQSRMNDTFTMALIKNRVRLCRELFAEMIFDWLLEDEVITTDITEALFLLGTRQRMNQVLMNILPFFGDRAFLSLVSALKKTGQGHLASLLEDYVDQHSPW